MTRHKLISRGWLTLLAMSAVGLASAGRLDAGDKLVMKGMPPYESIGVSGVDGKQGTITFNWQGQSLTKPLEDFEAIELDRYPSLGLGNTAMAEGGYAEAAGHFAAVQPLPDDRPWLTPLLTIMRIRACDKAGRFADAVSAWLEWQKEGWAKPKVAAPSNMPDKGASDLTAAVRLLESVKLSDADRQKEVQALLQEVYRRQGGDKAGDAAGESGVTAPARPSSPPPQQAGTGGKAEPAAVPADADEALLEPIRQAATANDAIAGLAAVEKAVPSLSKAALPEMFFLLGQVQERRGDSARAALAYMRLVVHFPRDSRTPKAAAEVARIHEDSLGRKDVAETIRKLLADRYPNSPEGRQAKAALAGGG